MGQAAFLRALVEHGRIRVEAPSGPAARGFTAPDDDDEIAAAVADWDAANRLEFPGDAPPLADEVARWALAQFYRACQFAVYRDVSAPEIDAALATACPAAAPAAQHYSVDLVFRFLPDLARLTKAASAADPLCTHVRRWADEWPLSSIGVAGVNPADLAAVCEHAGLLRTYADRVIARRDVSRLADPRVRSAVRAALGHFADLAPPVAAALKTHDEAAAAAAP